MPLKTITATEFQTRAGTYFDQAAKGPIVITKHRRPVRVLVDYDEYERLKKNDTREAYYAHELSDDLADQIKDAQVDSSLDKLNHLMD
ncbi:MAG: type II toxin-antitoxin system Phd/YefM family antitoxin [Rhodospirillaceae bacterium]